MLAFYYVCLILIEIIKMKYIKRSVEIEAFIFGKELFPDWFRKAIYNGKVTLNSSCDLIDSCTIRTLEGDMRAKLGDYIIKGVVGEIYPCKAEIFEKTYNLSE